MKILNRPYVYLTRPGGTGDFNYYLHVPLPAGKKLKVAAPRSSAGVTTIEFKIINSGSSQIKEEYIYHHLVIPASIGAANDEVHTMGSTGDPKHIYVYDDADDQPNLSPN